MVVGLLLLDLHFPQARSLKDKRRALNRIRDRLKQKYNIALAELDYQDKWQRTRLGMVTLNSQGQLVENMLHRIVEEVAEVVEGQVLHHEIQLL